MNQIDFRITKITDADFVDRVKVAVSTVDRSVSSISVHVVGNDLSDATQINDVLALGTFACQSITLKLNGDETIKLNREANTQVLVDQVQVSPKPGDTNAIQFAALVGALRKGLPDTAGFSHLSVLKDEERQIFTSRQNEINELQRIQVDFFRKFQDFVLEQKKREDDAKSALEQQAEKQRAEVEKERQDNRAAADAADAELEERRKKFDSRDATHVRRELREKLHEEIKSRQARFELTEGTKRRRLEVLGVWIVVLAALLLLIYGVSTSIHLAPAGEGVVATKAAPTNELDDGAAPQSVPTYVTMTEYLLTYGRQTGLIITFVVTAAFFLRWLNNWFSRHAEEEFKTKRLQLDVDRASWVFETALSWREEKESPVPQYLIERLSRNLFVEDEASDNSVTAADSLASALFGNSGRIKLLVSGNEIEVIRKGRSKPPKQ